MIGKNKITSITRLHQKKFRDASGLFLVEGIKSVADLLRSPMNVVEILATDEWLSKWDNDLSSEISITMVTQAEMERLSAWKNPQPVMAVAQMPDTAAEILDFDQPLLMLDDLRDPGNMGTIIRTADWFGIRQIACSENTVEVFNPKVIQATMGSFTRVAVCYTNLTELIDTKLQHRRILGTFLSGTPIQQVQFRPSDVIVIGNEANGISDNLAAKVTDKVLIDSPVKGADKAESLNASIAAAIMMYQLSFSV